MSLKPIILFASLGLALTSCTNTSNSNDWITLFNGKDLNDWTVKMHHYEAGDNYGNTFRVEDGLLKVRYDQYEFTDEFGHIFYKTPFKNFHLTVDYRFSGEFEKGGPKHAVLNSGVMFHSQSAESQNKEQNWPVSVEMQYLADLGDGKRTTGNMCSPGTNIEFQGKVFPGHCLKSNKKALPKDQWVTAELVVQGANISQYINGELVLEYSNPTLDGKDRTVKGKDDEFKQGGKPLQSGYIALQSEGQPIEFKNVKIKILD
ncbi:3-keto-disaccharide hydrolase [Paraglaciecola sp.]|uniref:3-keto-disaccharide hydrolase n=1 Tax=Paraglaciecola sp. TaxID=1920173 RepID=UPI003EF9DE80